MRTQFKIQLIILSILSLVFSQSSQTTTCTTITTQQDCSANSNCVWNKTDSFTCSNKINCSTLTSQSDCSTDNSSSCKWVQNDKPSCTLQPKTCQLTSDQSQCNHPNSCIYTKGKPATCTAKGNFGCDKTTDNKTCLAKSYCLWNDKVCNSTQKCEAQTNKSDCMNLGDYRTYCDFTVQECQVNSNAQQTCSNFKNSQQKCLDNGCVYDTGDIRKCLAPDSCTVIIKDNVAQCSSTNQGVCTISKGSCKTKKDICTNTALDTCNNTASFCSLGQCYDNKDFCQVNDCSNQQAQCDYTPFTDSTCTDNNENNECQNTDSQINCLSLGYCKYTSSSDECQNIQTCPLFSESLCKGYDSCSWNSVYQCQQAQVPNSYSIIQGFSLLMSFILVALI